jgi:hypothetical protein
MITASQRREAGEAPIIVYGADIFGRRPVRHRAHPARPGRALHADRLLNDRLKVFRTVDLERGRRHRGHHKGA